MNWQDQVLSCDEIRRFDQIAIEQFRIPSIVLMENAARNCVNVLRDNSTSHRVAIFCGAGNNGGDGLAMARILTTLRQPVHIFLLANPEQLSKDACIHWRTSQLLGIPTTIIDESCSNETKVNQLVSQLETDWIVDAILGTGVKLPLREPVATIVRILNQLKSRRFAVDLPTGLDGDAVEFDASETETSCPVFRADITVTFVARKPVMTTKLGQEYCGMIKVCDIGAPHTILNHL